MRRVTCVLLWTVFCLSGNAGSQESNQQNRKRAVIVPTDFVMLVIAHQPDCPLKFEKALIVKYIDGDAAETYQVRNCGKRPIRAYTIASWTSTGGGNLVTNEVARTGEPLMPAQTWPRNDERNEIEIVPLTEELRTKLNLHRPMKAVTVFMVVRVEFADGSTYSDEDAFKALQEYFERVGSRVIVN